MKAVQEDLLYVWKQCWLMEQKYQPQNRLLTQLAEAFLMPLVAFIIDSGFQVMVL